MDNDISFEIITLLNPSNEPFDIVYNNRIFRTIPPGKAMRLPKKPFGLLAEKHLIDRMCNAQGRNTNDPLARAHWREKIVLEEDVDNSERVMDPGEIMQRKLDKLNGTNEAEQIAECDVCGTKSFNVVEHKMLNHPLTAATPAAPTPPTQTVATAPAAGLTPAQPTAPIEPIIPANPEVLSATEVAGLPATAPAKPAPSTPAQKDVANVLSGVTGAGGEGHKLGEQKVQEVEAPGTYTINENPTREELIAYGRSIGMNVDEVKTKAFLDTAELDVIKKELAYGI